MQEKYNHLDVEKTAHRQWTAVDAYRVTENAVDAQGNPKKKFYPSEKKAKTTLLLQMFDCGEGCMWPISLGRWVVSDYRLRYLVPGTRSTW